ncbi:putative ATP synthase, F0 complex, subunit B/B' protein [Medicago truncatula]|uniref:ATP synthase, F0 subunit B n=2 Tax=Medicago truncatula TaxID=3880 RepID=G7JAI2_MEDTR|nr:ATP synthase subunit b', chloroplastic [Medicago truncatula]AES73621.1 ATP synthase, F0 subunit B [Medicago truncatula]AFK46888.1 unknown [Medicago truncatula]RHN70623.1 putative ATP synthase, F0 complex, subunit B/B' protein [Medicago truncatula]
MASMIMASSKPIIRVPTNSLPSTPKLPSLQTITPNLKLQLSKLKSMTLAATSLSFVFAPPSLAFEKAALFDFNLTLPIIVVEFLFLMFALDKLYFTPLGTFMDNRDAEIRGKLNSVTNTSEEVKELEEQANAVLRAARAEIAVALNQMKKETQAEVEEKIAEGRKKVDAELQEALANLEKQKEETVKALDSQIAALSQDIVNKVLPVSR